MALELIQATPSLDEYDRAVSGTSGPLSDYRGTPLGRRREHRGQLEAELSLTGGYSQWGRSMLGYSAVDWRIWTKPTSS